MTSEKESLSVRFVKYIENNYHHLYKNFEAIILFMLSAYCLADFTTLKTDVSLFFSSLNDRTVDSSLILKNIFSSYPLYLILFLLSVSIFITRKVSKETKTIEDENKSLKSDLGKKETELDETKAQLNEAEEAIDNLKNNNLETSFEIGSKFVAHIFTKLELTSRERISLYLKINGHFILAARYSRDSKFSEVHRKEFSIEQGVIGECWRLNRRILRHFPRNDAPYLKESIKQNFTEAEVKSFTMKSRSLIAQPINRDNFELIGVMVTESTREEWNFDENDDFYDEYHTLCRQFLIHYEKTINACKREVTE